MPDMIKNWDYLLEYKNERDDILKIADEVFSSGQLVLGRHVAMFEKEFSAFCGVSFGVGVNSGTDAIFLALKALGIGHGDEVITVSNTAVPTVAAIRATGAMPVFVDIEPDTFLMDVGMVEAAVTSKTKCIVPVHLYGQPVDMGPLMDIAVRRNLSVVEDCAQSAGALYKNKKTGGFGDIGAFSFYPTKILGGFGDGGMVVTEDKLHCERLKRLRFYGMEKQYYSEEEGYNSRLDEVHAAILSYKLKQLGASVQKRHEIASLYTAGLSSVGDIETPVVRNDRSHQFYLYTIKTAFRDELAVFLKENGIEARINYPVPIHLMRGYSFLGYREGALPVTEKMAGCILSLPMYPSLSAEMVEKVISAVRKFYSKI